MKTHTYSEFIQEDFYPNALVLFIAAYDLLGQTNNPKSIMNTLQSEQCHVYLVVLQESEFAQIQGLLSKGQQGNSLSQFELPCLVKYTANGEVRWIGGIELVDASKRQAFLGSN